MKKKNIIALLTIVLFSTSMALAQPRATDNNENHAEKGGAHNPENNNAPAPISTATALLLTLGAGTLGYKLKKNKKD